MPTSFHILSTHPLRILFVSKSKAQTQVKTEVIEDAEVNKVEGCGFEGVEGWNDNLIRWNFPWKHAQEMEVDTTLRIL